MTLVVDSLPKMLDLIHMIIYNVFLTSPCHPGRQWERGAPRSPEGGGPGALGAELAWASPAGQDPRWPLA